MKRNKQGRSVISMPSSLHVLTCISGCSGASSEGHCARPFSPENHIPTPRCCAANGCAWLYVIFIKAQTKAPCLPGLCCRRRDRRDNRGNNEQEAESEEAHCDEYLRNSQSAETIRSKKGEYLSRLISLAFFENL